MANGLGFQTSIQSEELLSPFCRLPPFAAMNSVRRGGSTVSFTATQTCAVTGPPLFVAVRVKVVVVAGLTLALPVAPLMGGTPGVMLTVSARDVFHDSVVLCPAVICPGTAVKEMIFGSCWMPPAFRSAVTAALERTSS